MASPSGSKRLTLPPPPIPQKLGKSAYEMLGAVLRNNTEEFKRKQEKPIQNLWGGGTNSLVRDWGCNGGRTDINNQLLQGKSFDCLS